ncbi:helix-turn-helix domain-containing protein [Paraflavitalea speifideaquila]|uniref:helix-turn-helix domain-containing protein n=1 Tax=Paraflavitalea speifideaquila TaxID=3076558 RepID=UPI0028E4950C|nr:helix-turn-helix domain-containing protein [Paraflavitalea speifideiaquila]
MRFGYSIRDLADDLEIPSYQLSAYLNREIGVNFNDYLNQFRVKYCEELLQQGMVVQLNFKGLALKCGFSNRNTLTTAFKSLRVIRHRCIRGICYRSDVRRSWRVANNCHRRQGAGPVYG